MGPLLDLVLKPVIPTDGGKETDQTFYDPSHPNEYNDFIGLTD
jgi:hypothetical protein